MLALTPSPLPQERAEGVSAHLNDARMGSLTSEIRIQARGLRSEKKEATRLAMRDYSGQWRGPWA